ncbi:MAG: hypothetical protein LKK13_04695 [Bacilli bacterium]|jgi:hypothetical protein|nr:hypothetical protein [Bacilli bacterium]
MKAAKEERLEAGEALHGKSLSALDCMDKCGVDWQRQHEVSAGLERPKPKAKLDQNPEYSAMAKERLLKEPVRNGIEDARLKKGMRRKGVARKRDSFPQAGGTPSGLGAFRETERPRPMRRDVRQPKQLLQMGA